MVKIHIETIKTAVHAYRMENDFRLPSTLDELLEPNENHLDRPYLEKAEYLIDPWGNPYQYILTDNNFKIVSLGADGIEELGFKVQ